jgi:hypothetical protein
MHSLTVAWFVSGDWSPQYRQTLFMCGGGADFVTTSLNGVRAGSHSRRPQKSPSSRVTAEHSADLYLRHTAAIAAPRTPGREHTPRKAVFTRRGNPM